MGDGAFESSLTCQSWVGVDWHVVSAGEPIKKCGVARRAIVDPVILGGPDWQARQVDAAPPQSSRSRHHFSRSWSPVSSRLASWSWRPEYVYRSKEGRPTL